MPPAYILLDIGYFIYFTLDETHTLKNMKINLS